MENYEEEYYVESIEQKAGEINAILTAVHNSEGPLLQPGEKDEKLDTFRYSEVDEESYFLADSLDLTIIRYEDGQTKSRVDNINKDVGDTFFINGKVVDEQTYNEFMGGPTRG